MSTRRAAVKAESDYCCTSGNAKAVIDAIPADRQILFLPDMFLGLWLERVTGRKLTIWMGECHVHAGIRPEDIDRMTAEDPTTDLLVHPECGCASQAMAFANDRTHILSTEGMIRYARETHAPRLRIATETGVLHGLRKAAPDTVFEPVREDAICRYMKMITLEKLRDSLRDMQPRGDRAGGDRRPRTPRHRADGRHRVGSRDDERTHRRTGRQHARGRGRHAPHVRHHQPSRCGQDHPDREVPAVLGCHRGGRRGQGAATGTRHHQRLDGAGATARASPSPPPCSGSRTAPWTFNLLDTPGHADFSEDTYRTLWAADAAVVVIDRAQGIETQTRKLYRVCRNRGVPVITFINKCDRPGRAPLELMDEIESEFGIQPGAAHLARRRRHRATPASSTGSRASSCSVQRTAHGASAGVERVQPIADGVARRLPAR